MKFGVREICNVVLKAKNTQKVGKRIFYANEPVIYFDTLKTSGLEGTGSTVYAQGGRGNSRLVAWEGERNVTFTMEDALISPEGFMILSGAGLLDASEGKPVYQHITETIDKNESGYGEDGELVKRVDLSEWSEGSKTLKIYVKEKPYMPLNEAGNFAYVMFVLNGEIVSEPYIPMKPQSEEDAAPIMIDNVAYFPIIVMAHDIYEAGHDGESYEVDTIIDGLSFDSFIVDYYTAKTAGAKQLEIRPDKFAGNYYLEADTLFRTEDGEDLAAEFVIPNCKIQSNFNFTMAASGDPSTFTFTMDAFPDYTRFDHSHKVLCAIQIIDNLDDDELVRTMTEHDVAHDNLVKW